MDRRDVLRRLLGLGLIVGGWPLSWACSEAKPQGRGAAPAGGVRVVKMGGPKGELVFSPDRLRIRVGETVRWVVESAGHSTTAYHPQNHEGYHSRIPDGAQPWNSGVLLQRGAQFEHIFTVAGVYHYYCIPHEGAGMVGAIVVGETVDGPAMAPVQPEISPAARRKLEELIAWAKAARS
jgi:plastocyanin